jgi:hypothetical protein
MPLTVYEMPYIPQESSFTFGQDSIGLEMAGLVAYGNPSSAAWPTANKAFYFPFTLQIPQMAYQLWVWNGATTSGNFDIGLFDESGTKLGSSGATAQSGASSIQTVDITDVLLPQGTTWLGLSFNNTTATTFRINPAAAYIAPLGCYVQTTAYPLPTTATYSRIDAAYVPMCGILFRTTI